MRNIWKIPKDTAFEYVTIIFFSNRAGIFEKS